MSDKQKVNIVMDMSQYDTYLMCHEKFNFRYNKNKGLPTKAKPLDRGSLVHVACETYYESIKSGAKYDFAVSGALLALKAAGAISDLDVDEINRTEEVMIEYFDHWRIADQSFSIIDVEKAFLYKVHEDDDVCIYLSGKIDLVYADNKYDKMPMDHKSMDRLHDINELSNQFRNYCRALESGYLIVNRIGFQKTLKPHEKFLRTPVSYTPDQLEQFRRNVVSVLLNEYLVNVAEDYWPTNETSCDKFNRKCEYYEVCKSSGIEAKLYKLSSNYIDVEPWDVTKSLAKSSEVLRKKEEDKSQ